MKSWINKTVLTLVIFGAMATLPFDKDAYAVTLNFSPPSGNNTAVDDNTFDTTRLDFTFQARIGGGSFGGASAIDSEGLKHFNTGYGDLTNVAFSVDGGNGFPGFGEIGVRVQSGFQATLVQFDMAGQGGDRLTEVKIFDEMFTSLLFQTSSITAPGTGRLTILPNLIFTDMINLQFIDNTHIGAVGIDNLVFNVERLPISVVPLPAALPLYGTGLALMGFVGWRRRQKSMAVN